MNYFIKTNSQLISLENKIFKSYCSVIDEYNEYFKKYSCKAVVTRCWTLDKPMFNSKTKMYSTVYERPFSYKRYTYWVSYMMVDKNNKPIVYDDENSYLQGCYGCVFVKKKKNIFTKRYTLCASVIENVEELKNDLVNDLKWLQTQDDGSSVFDEN